MFIKTLNPINKTKESKNKTCFPKILILLNNKTKLIKSAGLIIVKP